MKKFWMVFGLVCLAVQPLVADDLRERVERATTTIWIHGITQELADREIGVEGVPYLLELLQDPDFERRDNVVAFLGYLAYDSDAPRLMQFLDHPPTDRATPEEYRAKLLAPEALGRIASRGGFAAEDLLRRLKSDPTLEPGSGIAQMIDYGLSFIEQPTDLEEDPGLGDPDAGDPVVPLAKDTNPTVHLHDLTYANHVNTFNPITDSEVDAALSDVTTVMALENASNDTACCVQLGRTVPGTTFGVSGDGKDVINSSSKLNSVIGLGVARIKVVDVISWCGGPGSNIIGCGLTPGKGIVLVRLSGTGNEGKLWAHEFGHNTGLGHNGNFGFIMTSGLSSANTRVSSFECSKFHVPSGAAQAVPLANGVCHDDDNDDVMSAGDNCPFTANQSQADSDSDDVGNACDNCTGDPNPDQVDCDSDGSGDVCDPEILIPGPVEEILFASSQDLTWEATPFRKKVYKGFQNAGQAWHYTEALEAVVNSGTIWSDPEVPDSGNYFYYLVTQFTPCGESD